RSPCLRHVALPRDRRDLGDRHGHRWRRVRVAARSVPSLVPAKAEAASLAMESWTFASNSILNRLGPYSAPKEVFHAVCDELALFFAPEGWKYRRSRPELTRPRGALDCVMAFWSSRSNMPGQQVALEVVAHIRCKQLKKWIAEHGVGRNDAIAMVDFYDPITKTYE